MWKFFALLLACFVSLTFSSDCQAENEIVWVSHGSRSTINFSGASDRKIKIVELAPYEELEVAKEKPAAWSGTLESKGEVGLTNFSLPRHVEKRDRYFSRWVVLEAQNDEVLQGPIYAEPRETLREEIDKGIPKPTSIKGLQCIVDQEDALNLGVKQVAHNVDLKQLFDFTGQTKEFIEIDGVQIPLNSANIKRLDQFINKMSDAGVSVNLILLNYVPTSPNPNNPLIHPATNLKEAPNHLGAFNLTDRKGYLYYRAAVEYLVNRYSQENDAHGKIAGLIIGNELQAHWWWYNMGDADAETVIRNYERALRVASLVVESVMNTNIRVYTSMDHHWTASMVPNEKRFIPGKKFLDGLNKLTQKEGNYFWHVAFHPYPENLFEPRTWNDQQATLTHQTPKITFKNLEVLTDYLSQEIFQFQAEFPRRIILSEQGFHAGEGEEGELAQAAAYAYAYYRASHLPGIDAFILHRHVDHAHEGGLKLGLRDFKPGTISSPGRKRKIYEVFQQADTDHWETAFEFAKPIIGIKDWNELDPKEVTVGPVP